MSKMNRIYIVLTVLIITITYNPSFTQTPDESQHKVLILRSVNDNSQDTTEIIMGFQTSMNLSNNEYDIVDIHSQFISDKLYKDGLKLSLKAMLQSNVEYDAVLLIRESAAQFALEINNEFVDIPIIYAMLENEVLENQILDKFYAIGVTESTLLRENIILMKSLVEKLEKVYIIADHKSSDATQESALKEEVSLFADEIDINYIFGNDIQSETVDFEQIDSSSSLIYYMSKMDSKELLGETMVNELVVFTPFENKVGDWVVGGRVLDTYNYGVLLAEQTKKMILNNPATELESLSAPSKYVFDAQIVNQLGIELDFIDREVQYINIKDNKSIGATIIFVLLFIFSVLVIVHLVLIRRRNEKMHTVFDPVSNFMSEIMSNVDNAISIKDEDRNYIRVNEKFNTLFGFDQDVIGRMDSNIFPVEFAKQLKLIDDRASFGSDDYQKKLIFNHKETGALYLEFKVMKLKDNSGKIYLISYISDLTEQKKHEKTLAELNKILEQQVRDRTGELIQAEKMAILGTLVAGVSHEISTPIGVSITASTFLSDQTNHLKKQFESGALKKSDMTGFLDLLDETGEILFNNLSNAAEMITNFKKVAVDQASEEIREFNLKDYSRGVVMNLKPKFKHTHHKIYVLGDEDLIMYSYPGALNQILTNLILNSLIHGFENVESGEIRIKINKRNDLMGVRIEYTDNGQGIAKDNVSKVFDPFYTTKRGKGGSGLGMNIVRNLVEKALNGGIKVYSDAGEGVRFVLDFPQRINVYEKPGNTDMKN